jgi:uncharacterized membrane protein
MNKIIRILNILAIIFLSFIMVYGAYNHVANPAFYNGFIPAIFPKLIVNYFSAVVELIIGLLIIVPKWRKMGSLSFIGLMIAFFPIHIWDFLKEVPAIGSKEAAIIRLVVQFIFIGIAYFTFKKSGYHKV